MRKSRIGTVGLVVFIVCVLAAPGEAVPPYTSNNIAHVTKRGQSLPQHIHLVFEGTGDPADPCHTGDTFKENSIGDIDNLMACVFDDTHTPATTDQPEGGWLRWSIAPSGGGELNATRFPTTPPSETGPDGRATAELETFRLGNDIIRIELMSDSGTLVSEASIQKRVVTNHATACDDSIDNDGDGFTDFPDDRGCTSEFDDSERLAHHTRYVSINFDHARKPGGGRTLIVTGLVRVPFPDRFNRCRRGVQVSIQRFAGGQGWVTRTTDTTGRRGRYAVEIQDMRGTYRVVAARIEVLSSQGERHLCGRAHKKRTHRH